MDKPQTWPLGTVGLGAVTGSGPGRPRGSGGGDAILDGCCDAWDRLRAEPGRVASLTDHPYLRPVRTS